MTEFVGVLADHPGDDERVIASVVFGDAGFGTVEIVFGMPRSASERDTHVAVFDIIHGAGKALGCQWRNDPGSSGRVSGVHRRRERWSVRCVAHASSDTEPPFVPNRLAPVFGNCRIGLRRDGVAYCFGVDRRFSTSRYIAVL